MFYGEGEVNHVPWLCQRRSRVLLVANALLTRCRRRSRTAASLLPDRAEHGTPPDGQKAGGGVVGSWLGSGRPRRPFQLFQVLGGSSIHRIELQSAVEVPSCRAQLSHLPPGNSPIDEGVRVSPAAADRPVEVPQRLPRAALLQQESAEVVVEACRSRGEAKSGFKGHLSTIPVAGLGKPSCEVVDVIADEPAPVDAGGATWRRRVTRQFALGDHATALQGLEVDVVRPMDCQDDVVAKHQRIEQVSLFGKGQYRSDHRGTGAVPIQQYVGNGVLDWARCRPGRGQPGFPEQSVDHAARVGRRALLITSRRLKPQRLGSSPRTIDSFEPKQVPIESEEGVDKRRPLRRLCSVGDHVKQTREESRYSKRQRQKETTMTKVRSRTRHHAQQAGLVSVMSLALCVLATLAFTPALAEFQNDEVGFSPNHIFEGGIGGESVDVMTGNVNIRIPIGPRYRLNDWFGYQLELYYNSKIWKHHCDIAHPDDCVGTIQGLNNFGLGFSLFFGWVRQDPEDKAGVYRYVSPSGSERFFCYSPEAGPSGCPIFDLSPDAEPIQVQKLGSGATAYWEALPGDGTKVVLHHYRGTPTAGWLATRIETVARNAAGTDAQQWVEATYTGTSATMSEINDSAGRHIAFTPSGIVLPAFGGSENPSSATSTYVFAYASRSVEDPVTDDPDGSNPPPTNKTVLTEIQLPELNSSEKYEFLNYGIHGYLTRWKVPTGAQIDYYYTHYSSSAGKPLHSNLYCKELRADNQVYRWTYTRFGDGLIRSFNDVVMAQQGLSFRGSNPNKVRVLDPFNNLTVYWFHQTPFGGLDCDAQGCLATWDDGLLTEMEVFAGPGESADRLVRRQRYTYAYDGPWLNFKFGSQMANANAVPLKIRLVEEETYVPGAGAEPSTTTKRVFSGWTHDLPGGFQSSGVAKPRTVLEYRGNELYRTTTTDYSWSNFSFHDLHTYSSTMDAGGVPVATTQVQFINTNQVDWQIARKAAGGTGTGFVLQPGDIGLDNVYDADGNLMTATVSGGDNNGSYVTHYTYNHGTLATQRVDPFTWWSKDRDIDGNTGLPIASRDAAGFETSYGWDSLGRLTAITRPVHERPTEIDYTTLHETRVRRDVNQNDYTESRFFYDQLGRLNEEWQRGPGGVWNKRKTEYDGFTARVKRQSEWAPDGTPPGSLLWTTYEYGTFENLNPQPGEPNTWTDPDGRVSKVTLPDGSLTETRYEGLATVVTTFGIQGSQGPMNATTRYRSDDFGRLVSVDAPGTGADAEYSYDEQNNLTRVDLTSPGSGIVQSRHFLHDDLGRLRYALNPENGAVSYLAYGPRGELLEWQDARQKHFKATYDTIGRLLTKSVQVGSTFLALVENSYDTGSNAAGRLNQQLSYKIQGSGRTLVSTRQLAYGEDPSAAVLCDSALPGVEAYPGLNGRLRSASMRVEPWARNLETVYCQNSLGLPAVVAYPEFSGSVRTPRSKVWSLFQNGALWEVHDAGRDIEYLAHVEYDPHGAVTRIDRGKTADIVTRDGLGRLLGLETWRTAGSPPVSVSSAFGCGGQSGTPPYELQFCNHPTSPATIDLQLWTSGTYAYDGAGNIKGIGSDDYSYDELNRLVTAEAHTATIQYSMVYGYDAFGNMTNHTKSTVGGGMQQLQQQTFQIDIDTNRLVAMQPDAGAQPVAYAYDASGNMTEEPGRAYVYDEQGRMIEVWVSGERIATYDYDANGYRVRAIDDDAETLYFRDETGAVLSEFRRAPGEAGEPTWNKDYVYALGQALKLIKNDRPQVPGRPWATSVTGNGLVLHWDPVEDPDISKYRVRKVIPDSLDKTYLINAPTTTFTDTYSPVNPAVATYTVEALDTANNGSGPSPQLLVRPNTTAPPVPTGLTAVGEDRRVRLGWTALTNVDDLAGYRVERGPASSGPWTLLTGQALEVTEYLDFNLENGQTYWYRLRAIDTAGNQSAATASVSATPHDTVPPARPVGLAAGAGLTTGTIDLLWSGVPDQDLAYYRLCRSSGSGAPVCTITVTAPTTSYHDVSLPTQIDYSYTVAAVDTSGNTSVASDPIIARPRVNLAPPTLTGEFWVDPSSLADPVVDFYQDHPYSIFEFQAEDDDLIAVRLVPQLSPSHDTFVLGTRIYRATGSSGVFALLAEVDRGEPEHVDYGISGHDYSYYAVAIRRYGLYPNETVEEGAASPIVHVVDEFDPSTFVRNTNAWDGRVAYEGKNARSRVVRIRWSRVAESQLVGYHVYRRCEWRTCMSGLPSMETFACEHSWVRVSEEPIQEQVFEDRTPRGLKGCYVYAVRPVGPSGVEGPIFKAVSIDLYDANPDDDHNLCSLGVTLDGGIAGSCNEDVSTENTNTKQWGNTFSGEVTRINNAMRGTGSAVGAPASPFGLLVSTGDKDVDLAAGIARRAKYVSVEWTQHPASDLAGYHVEMAGSSQGPWERLTERPVAWWETHYDVRGLWVGAGGPKCVTLRLVAVDEDGNESLPSAAVQYENVTGGCTAVATLPAPTNLRASTQVPPSGPIGSPCTVRLEWDPVTDAVNYRVYRMTYWSEAHYFYQTQLISAASGCAAEVCSYLELGEPGAPPGQSSNQNIDCPYRFVGSCSTGTLEAYYVTAERTTGGPSPRSNIAFWNCANPDGSASVEHEGDTLYAAKDDSSADSGSATRPAPSDLALLTCPDDDARSVGNATGAQGASPEPMLAPLATLGFIAGNPPYKILDIHVDHLGSTRLVTDSAGTILSAHDYFPFGKEIAPMADYNTKGFTGHERDDVDGLHYMRARYYAPGINRFIAADSAMELALLEPGKWNKYAYVSNDPLSYKDPTGHLRVQANAVVHGTYIPGGEGTPPIVTYSVTWQTLGNTVNEWGKTLTGENWKVMIKVAWKYSGDKVKSDLGMNIGVKTAIFVPLFEGRVFDRFKELGGTQAGEKGTSTIGKQQYMRATMDKLAQAVNDVITSMTAAGELDADSAKTLREVYDINKLVKAADQQLSETSGDEGEGGDSSLLGPPGWGVSYDKSIVMQREYMRAMGEKF